MTTLLYISALVLLVVAVLATFTYARAVAHHHRAYVHVVLAGVYVLVIEVIAVSAVSDESSFAQGALLITNLVGIGAMGALAARFRSREEPAEVSSAYVWYQQHKGFIAFVVIVVLAGIGLWRVENIASDADNAADVAETTAVETEDALCALRADQERRMETSQEFLRENPEGIPGIPAEVIQRGIEGQRSTIEALSNLSC